MCVYYIIFVYIMVIKRAHDFKVEFKRKKI